MKRISVFLCLVLFSTGCVPKKEKGGTLGPLSKINEYQVTPLFLLSETSDREFMLNYLTELLEKSGTVDISTNCVNDTPGSCAGMLISISDLEQVKTGSINIFAEAEIVINKHKTSCEAWKTFFHDPTLPYPVDEKGRIAFKKDPTAESPDLKTVIAQMVEQFSEQYRQDNPGSKPTFHVYNQFLSTTPANKT